MMDTSPTDENEKDYVVAIGASAGGITAIHHLIGNLPAKLDAPLVIAMHSEPQSKLFEVLKDKSPMPVLKAEDGITLEKGNIYVVPGATHALLAGGRLKLSEIVRDSGFRPSIDALFMTLAAEYGDRAIAVVLSGSLTDGMRGAQVIHDLEGSTIVQSPEDAEFPGMPLSVIRRDHPEIVLPATGLAKWLADLIGCLDEKA